MLLPKCFQGSDEIKAWKGKCLLCLSERCECHQHYTDDELKAAQATYDDICAEYNGARLLEPGDWGRHVQTETGVIPFVQAVEMFKGDEEFVVYIMPKKTANEFIIPSLGQYNGPKMLRFPLKT